MGKIIKNEEQYLLYGITTKSESITLFVLVRVFENEFGRRQVEPFHKLTTSLTKPSLFKKFKMPLGNLVALSRVASDAEPINDLESNSSNDSEQASDSEKETEKETEDVVKLKTQPFELNKMMMLSKQPTMAPPNVINLTPPAPALISNNPTRYALEAAHFVTS